MTMRTDWADRQILVRFGKCILSCAVALAMDLAAASAHARSYTVLYSFGEKASGAAPNGTLIMDASGNLYGTTSYNHRNAFGELTGNGIVFKVAPNGTETVLGAFSGKNGAHPSDGLMMDANRNLYGTTWTGGDSPCGCGVVFEISPDGTHSTLYAFHGHDDGGLPNGNLIMNGAGNLYGTTYLGGSGGLKGSPGYGTVYELVHPKQGQTQWTKTVLHSFRGYPNDGEAPLAGLIMDSSGNLYGTTFEGGGDNGDAGTVFELVSPKQGQTRWTETVLYAFRGHPDGSQPEAGLIMDASGSLFGTTNTGGTGHGFPPDGTSCGSYTGYCGTVFRLAPPGNGQTRWTETVLYSFCRRISCADGASPSASLINVNGTLYGTTNEGGTACSSDPAYGCGTIFSIAPDGTETILHSFCSRTRCDGGASPSSSLIMDGSGNLYGTTGVGGIYSGGVVFKFAP